MMKPEYEIDAWSDCLGQQYGPGDCVGYASISGKSPQLVVAEVVAIYTHNASGKRYTENTFRDGGWQFIDSVSVKVMPLLDGREFYRGSNPKPVHLKITGNIVKLPSSLKPLPKAERDLQRNIAGVTEIYKDLSR